MLVFELQKDPKAEVIWDETWACHVCHRHTRLELDQKDKFCVFCTIDGSGKDHVIFFGWRLTRSGAGQINASRIDQ